MPVSSTSELFPPSDALKVKICGITRERDARDAIDAGADALGFNFYAGSKRYLDPDAGALDWIARLPGPSARVAVVVNAGAALLERLRDSGCFDAVQLHGDEPPQACEATGFRHVIRAVRVDGRAAFDGALRHPVTWLLFDASVPGAYGGTGRTVDWELAAEFIRANPGRRVVLAGGLTPGNVAAAVASVRPHAVDVAGGVESAPGIKDAQKVRGFVRAAKAAGGTAKVS